MGRGGGETRHKVECSKKQSLSKCVIRFVSPFPLQSPFRHFLRFSPFFAEHNVQTESDSSAAATAAVTAALSSPPRSLSRQQPPPQVPPCPLCQDSFADYAALENHVMQVRKRGREGNAQIHISGCNGHEGTLLIAKYHT